MRKLRILLLLAVLVTVGGSLVAAEDNARFPKPDFESGYVMPSTPTPAARFWAANYLDVGVLLFALSLAAYLVYGRRSRRGIFWLTVGSLGYFGFYREGCVCPIGAIQNVSKGLFDTSFGVSWIVLAFFLLPLIFALFFGRIFCAAVCPLGAIQELVTLRPLRMPIWLKHILGLVPHLYLGLAVLFAALGGAFIICQLDPFISIFRLTGELEMYILGASFLVVGIFIGRPYCRFLCPYGVLLSWCARLSPRRLSIYPETCVTCHLCENSCPYDCIRPANTESDPAPTTKRRVLWLLCLLPIFIAVGAFFGHAASPILALNNYTVATAVELKAREDKRLLSSEAEVDDADDAPESEVIAAFVKTEKSPAQVYAAADAVREKFGFAGYLLGGFIGLVIGLRLLANALSTRRDSYEVEPGHCYTCGRCYDHCPKELEYQDRLVGIQLGGSAQARWIFSVRQAEQGVAPDHAEGTHEADAS